MHNITDGHVRHHLFSRRIPHYILRRGTRELVEGLANADRLHMYNRTTTRDLAVQQFTKYIRDWHWVEASHLHGSRRDVRLDHFIDEYSDLARVSKTIIIRIKMTQNRSSVTKQIVSNACDIFLKRLRNRQHRSSPFGEISCFWTANVGRLRCGMLVVARSRQEMTPPSAQMRVALPVLPTPSASPAAQARMI